MTRTVATFDGWGDNYGNCMFDLEAHRDPQRNAELVVIWRVRLICCGRDAGDVMRNTWEEADAFRDAYTRGTGVRYFDGRIWHEGHDRAGIIERIG